MVLCLSLKMLILEINDKLLLFCLSVINYISWYLYDICWIISYLRVTISTAENIVRFIYHSDNLFLYNLRAIYPCITYISFKKKHLWPMRWHQFLHYEFSVYIQQNSSRTCIRNIYLSFDRYFRSLWILAWLLLWLKFAANKKAIEARIVQWQNFIYIAEAGIKVWWFLISYSHKKWTLHSFRSSNNYTMYLSH